MSKSRESWKAGEIKKYVQQMTETTEKEDRKNKEGKQICKKKKKN